MLTILFDGVAYGMLLFILAVGLAVTMGLMNFINLAHGAFAMVGGYITVLLMQRAGVPFLLCLPIAFVGTALLGAALCDDRLFDLHQAMFSDTSPGPVKYALSRVHDWFSPEVRLPIIPANDVSRAAVDAALSAAGVI